MSETHAKSVPVPELCSSLVIPDRQRRAAMKTIFVLENQVSAFARSMLGYNAFGDKDEAASVKERAAAIIDAIREGEPTEEDPSVVALVRLQYEAIRPSIDSLTKIRREAEKDMAAIAEQLPVCKWVKEHKGFGVGNLAYIVAATGDLSKYDTVSKVWKRLGLAVIDGDRQGSPKSKTAEAYIQHGYNKHRRCVAYLLQASLVKGSDYYRGICNTRKEYERTRIERPMHIRNRAERYMVKRAIADLWGAWHGLEVK